MEHDFDITVTGFDMGEIDLSVSQSEDSEEDQVDQLPKVDATRPPITQPGDVWQLDRHRLMCADATKPVSFDKLMQGELAEMIFSDPPRNVGIDGHVSGHGACKSGGMSEKQYIGFLQKTHKAMAAHSRDGAVHFVCMDWRHIADLLTAGLGVYDQLLDICVWVRTNGGLGSLYPSQYKVVAVFNKGSAPHINNVKFGRSGRNRTNVWTYASTKSFGSERDGEALRMHPTVKPVALVRDAILDCSNRGGIVLDAFAGSGTTLIAAHLVGRRGFGLEIEPRYVDVALRRFRALTGIEPLHVDSGLKFKDLERAGQPASPASSTRSPD
jgi:DNA modification methylase